MPSIEILVENVDPTTLGDLSNYSFTAKLSSPPASHRRPSLWQERFEAIGGVLVHLGTKSSEGTGGWFYAYDLIEEYDCKRFRFKPEYRDQVASMLRVFLSASATHRLHFTSDWQFGPRTAEVCSKILNADEFVDLHDKSGLRFNSWITVAEKPSVNMESNEKFGNFTKATRF